MNIPHRRCIIIGKRKRLKMLKLRPLQIFSHIHFDYGCRMYGNVYAERLKNDHSHIHQSKHTDSVFCVRHNKVIDRVTLEKRNKNIHSCKQNVQSQCDQKVFFIRFEKGKHLRPCSKLKRLIILLLFISCHVFLSPRFCRRDSSESRIFFCKSRFSRSVRCVFPSLPLFPVSAP